MRRVLDLCSGTGEPVRILIDWMTARGERVPAFVLSDLFPHHAAFAAATAAHPGVIFSEGKPMSATAVPATIAHDARVIINSLHHFRPEVAAAVLADAVAARGDHLRGLSAQARAAGADRVDDGRTARRRTRSAGAACSSPASPWAPRRDLVGAGPGALSDELNGRHRLERWRRRDHVHYVVR